VNSASVWWQDGDGVRGWPSRPLRARVVLVLHGPGCRDCAQQEAECGTCAVEPAWQQLRGEETVWKCT
jgi:hypothetical protein